MAIETKQPEHVTIAWLLQIMTLVCTIILVVLAIVLGVAGFTWYMDWGFWACVAFSYPLDFFTMYTLALVQRSRGRAIITWK